MDRYIGLDAHATSCTSAVISANGKRLRGAVVETNGQALVEFVRIIAGRRHLCLEEGMQSAWLYEVLSRHVDEIVATHVSESRGPKSDARDAFDLAEKLRTGAVRTSVFKDVGREPVAQRPQTSTVRGRASIGCLGPKDGRSPHG